MRSHSRAPLILVLALSSASMSGCVGAALTGNPWLAVAGVGFAVGAFDHYENNKPEVDYNSVENLHRRQVMYQVILAAALKQTDPGHNPSLNALPVSDTLIKEQGLSEAQILHYNEQLPRVIELNRYLESQMKLFKENKLRAKDFDDIATRLALKDRKELIDTLRGKSLSIEKVQAMATQWNIDVDVAQFYLKTTFKVSIALPQS
jgi:hypothetical protein